MQRGAATRLFHAIVGLGLAGGAAACGGLTAAGSRDASSDGTLSDALGAADSTATTPADAEVDDAASEARDAHRRRRIEPAGRRG